MKSTNNINVVLTNEHVESGFKTLEDNGLNIFHFPMIRTKPISNITKIDLDQIDCIIFVSKNIDTSKYLNDLMTIHYPTRR